MKCPLCGHQFREEEGKAGCGSCPVGGGCHMVMCPNCGYEIPKEPGLVKALKNWRKKIFSNPSP